ncbi:hypothetical protein RND81_12G069300 [Saponaria officinalis]|uniref:Aminotransferase-like plant mobile domain-containing protein n=1 Tax=Saponaria officinalis TaxID=3572 RepID=A0AAW1H7I1_SAPOF
MVSSSTAAPVVSEDSEREMSREIEVGFEEHLGDDHHIFDVGDDEEDDGDSTSMGMKKTKSDLSWRLKGAVFGGPSHFNVLRSFGGHVAFSSWSNLESLRPWIKCYERPGYLEQMNEIKFSDAVSRRINDSGFGHLSHCMTTNLDANLISAFEKRWQPYTNPFLMPFGEISIMLHDVYHIVGIRVDGRKVFVNGVVEEEEGSRREDACLKTRRLRTVVESGNQHDSLMAYMMMLLGQTLFLDKLGDRAIARMLGWFDDLSVISEGYYVKDRPLVEAWSHVPRFKGDRALLEQHRQRLDGLRAEYVAWSPYGFHPDRDCRTTLYSGLIRVHDIVEAYQLDCCLRQFGYCKTIPMHMITLAREHRPTNLPKSGYRVDFRQYADEQWRFADAIITLSERSRLAVMLFDTVPRYMRWYESISHQYFYASTHRIEFARIGPIWEELEVARAVAWKFSIIYMKPTLEARRMYIAMVVDSGSAKSFSYGVVDCGVGVGRTTLGTLADCGAGGGLTASVLVDKDYGCEEYADCDWLADVGGLRKWMAPSIVLVSSVNDLPI